MVEINEGIKKVIENNALGFATIDKKGNPHNIAVGYVKVVSKDELVITDNYLEETVENIKANPNVSLVVWMRNWEENCGGYELKGIARYFTEGKWPILSKKFQSMKANPAREQF